MTASGTDQISGHDNAKPLGGNADGVSHLAEREYLEKLERLAQELELAMQAIVERALPTLKESVSRQLVLCDRLTTLSHRLSTPAALPNPELAQRIIAALHLLGGLNKRYSALVQHSTETMRLFAGLFRGYNDLPQHGSVKRASHHTWSCEL